MLEVLEVLLLPSGDGHFGYSSFTWPGLWKCQFLLFSTTKVKKEILKKNRQEDVGMVKVLWHLISSLIKIYINIYFLNWVHSKNWRKTFVVTLWCFYLLEIYNAWCARGQRKSNWRWQHTFFLCINGSSHVWNCIPLLNPGLP
jgi:hypothetical protein